jgi:hypothetical protein
MLSKCIYIGCLRVERWGERFDLRESKKGILKPCTVIGSFVVSNFTKFYSGDKVKDSGIWRNVLHQWRE